MMNIVRNFRTLVRIEPAKSLPFCVLPNRGYARHDREWELDFASVSIPAAPHEALR